MDGGSQLIRTINYCSCNFGSIYNYINKAFILQLYRYMYNMLF